MNTLFNAIKLAANEPDLDKAVAIIQAVLGQPHGDFAGLFFSKIDQSDEPDQTQTWATETTAERKNILIEYISQEIKNECHI